MLLTVHLLTLCQPGFLYCVRDFLIVLDPVQKKLDPVEDLELG